jgi:hypothetical protein
MVGASSSSGATLSELLLRDYADKYKYPPEPSLAKIEYSWGVHFVALHLVLYEEVRSDEIR